MVQEYKGICKLFGTEISGKMIWVSQAHSKLIMTVLIALTISKKTILLNWKKNGSTFIFIIQVLIFKPWATSQTSTLNAEQYTTVSTDNREYITQCTVQMFINIDSGPSDDETHLQQVTLFHFINSPAFVRVPSGGQGALSMSLMQLIRYRYIKSRYGFILIHFFFYSPSLGFYLVG